MHIIHWHVLIRLCPFFLEVGGFQKSCVIFGGGMSKYLLFLTGVVRCTELRFVHFLSDFFKAGILGQDIQNPNKVWKVTCKIARVFAEICRFYQKVSLKWPHFTRKVTPFFSFKNIFFPDKNEFWEFLYKYIWIFKTSFEILIAGLF